VDNYRASIRQRRKEIKTWHERSYDQKIEEIINIDDDDDGKVRLRQTKLNINTGYVLHNQIKTHSLTTEWVSTTRRKFFVVDFSGNMDRRSSECNKENYEM